MLTLKTIPSAPAFVRGDAIRLVILLISALALNSCAALQPLNPTGPRGTDPVYPILLTEDGNRRESVAAALDRLAHPGVADSAAAELQPVTATILSLPSGKNTGLFLPKIGIDPTMNEEESRESLRRFIKEWQELIGADPAKLSLLERVDRPDGTKLANYEQRPFRYPLRGNYGKLQIHFAPDRRVLNLTSTCIPDADRMQATLSALIVRLKAEDAAKQLHESSVTYADSKGNRLSFSLPATGETKPRGLVTYILASKSHPNALEFHLAWEVELTNAPIKTAYVDALSGEVLAAE